MGLLRPLLFALSILTAFSLLIGFLAAPKEHAGNPSIPETPYWLPTTKSSSSSSSHSSRETTTTSTSSEHQKSSVGLRANVFVPQNERDIPANMLVHRTLDIFLDSESQNQNVTGLDEEMYKGNKKEDLSDTRKEEELVTESIKEKAPNDASIVEEVDTTGLKLKPNPLNSKADTTLDFPHDKSEHSTLVDATHSNFFVVLGDSRSGTEWIVSILNQHPDVCAPGNYPVGALVPTGFSWLNDNDPEKACTYAFLRDHILQRNEETCSKNYLESEMGQKDPLGPNLARICKLRETLQGNISESTVLSLWMDLFTGKMSMPDEMMCACPVNSQSRGIKILSDWMEKSPLQINDVIASSKVIRFHRKNLWARYMSLLLAQKSDIWTVASAEDRDRRLKAVKEPIEISIDEMLDQFGYMQKLDESADRWAKNHDTLSLEYEECLENVSSCFQTIYQFLGIDSTHVVEQTDLYRSTVPSSNSDRLLEVVSNADIVREALGANGMGDCIGMSSYEEIQHLIFEPESGLVRNSEHRPGIKSTLVHRNFAPKHDAVLPYLRDLAPNALVVISEGGNTGLNHHIRSNSQIYQAIVNARQSFNDLTKDRTGAVVISATNECCASALTHASPGDLFDTDGKRTNRRACRSGDKNCQWNDNTKATRWQSILQGLATNSSSPTKSVFVYPDASFISGRARDIVAFFNKIQVNGTEEDERAIIADFMYRNPNAIILDSEQRIFGKGFDGVHSSTNENCPLVKSSERQLVTGELSRPTAPIFIYRSAELGCGEKRAVSDTINSFPVWDDSGIRLQPIVDHIETLNDKDISLAGIDRHFGPEILYVVDADGVWTSQRIQGRINNETSHFRVKPTEKLLCRAHWILMQTDSGSSRWKELQKAVRSGSGFPYWGFYGDFKACNYHNDGEESVPIFTTCAITGCNHAFPTPAYMTMIDSQESSNAWYKVFRQFDRDYPWANKIRKVVWRGALSENDPKKVFESQRWRLCKKANEIKNDLFDVGLVYIPQFLKDQMGDIDLSPVGGLKKGISPMNDFQRYFAILDMDGNSWSSRFGTLLCYNSVAVKVEPKYLDYFFYDLKPWKHYVPVREDLSDLEENVSFIFDPKNEAVVKDIIASANQWCAEQFVHSELARDVLDIWEDYIRRLDQSDPKWTELWLERKHSIFSSNLKMKLINQNITIA